MQIPAAVADFWKRFNAHAGGVDPARFYEAFHFSDDQETADALADLVLDGTKRATAGLLASFEDEGKRLPRPGDLSVVTNWAGTPLCVIETLQVDVVRFNEVTAAFAAVEGEGDGSLGFWRGAHISAFARECTRIGQVFDESMPIACERFRVVWIDDQSSPSRSSP